MKKTIKNLYLWLVVFWVFLGNILFAQTQTFNSEYFTKNFFTLYSSTTISTNYNVNITGKLTADSAKFSNLTSGYIPYYGSTRLKNSNIYFNGTKVGIGTTAPVGKLQVAGTSTYNSDTAKAFRVSDGTTLTKAVDIGYDITLNRGFIQAGNFGTAFSDLLLNPNLGNVGIGTTLVGGTNPAMTSKVNVFSTIGNQGFSVWDASVLGSETLNNTTLTSGTKWAATNDCSIASNNATWTYSAGTASTLTQSKDSTAIKIVPNRWYKLVYTVSAVSGTPTANVTTTFASATTALTLSAGTQTTYVKSDSTVGNFVITSTLTAGQAFTLDDISLKELQSGDISLGGQIKLAGTDIVSGTTGNQTINKSSGSVNIAALGTSVTVTNSYVTSSTKVFAVVATNDATAYVKNVVCGTGSFVITLGAAATAETRINWILFN